MSTSLAAALLAELGDDDLDTLAEMLRPRLGLRASARDDELLSTREAADYLRCSTGRIYNLRHAGEITPQRDGKKLLFRRAELDRYLQLRAGR